MDELLDSINDGDTLSNLSRENCSSHHVRKLELLVQKLKLLNSRFTCVWQTHSHRMDIACSFRTFEASYRNIILRLTSHEKLLSSTEYGCGTEWIEQLISMHRTQKHESQVPFKNFILSFLFFCLRSSFYS